MKIKEGYVLREVANEIVVVPVGKESLNLNGIITLNESGKFLWEELVKGSSMDELVTKMTSSFEVNSAEAKADIEEFIFELNRYNILENDE